MDKASILYIESVENQRKALARQLRSKGYKVATAASGQTGLDLFEKRTFDVILCDFSLPGIDGIDILDRIRCRNKDVPFIIYAARGSAAQAKKAIKKGADQFVLKPKEIHEIVIIIEQVLERSRLEKTTAESQAFLKMVTENVPDIIYSLNPKGEFVSLSPSVEHVMGYKPSELMGASVFKIIHQGDRQRVKASFMKAARSIDTRDKILQFRMVTKTGETKHFEIRRKMAIEDGRMIRNDGIAREITHRIILEQKLKEYHQQMAEANLDMQAVIDAIPHVIFLVDHEGIIKASNRSVYDYFGVSPDEIIGSSYDKFIASIESNFEDFDKFLEELDQCKRTPDCAGQLSASDVYKRGVRVIRHKPGILSPSCFRVQDEKNKETGLVWVYTDVSFIKQADEQVHAIVNSSPIPTIISSLEDGRILYANQELASLVGLSTDELIGQMTPDFYYVPDDRKIVVESLKRDGFLRDFETQIKKADGTVVWMIFSLVVAQMGGEKVILGWLYDISERKKAEEAIAIRLRYEEGLAACSQALWKGPTSKDALTEAAFF